jgi:hypothetical protein
MNEIKFKVNDLLTKYKISEYWNFEEVQEFISEAKIEGIDPLFIVALIKAELANYFLIERAMEVAQLPDDLEKKVSGLKKQFEANLKKRKMPFALYKDTLFLSVANIDNLKTEGKEELAKIQSVEKKLSKYGLLELQNEIVLSSRILLILHKKGIELDELRTTISPMYKELDEITALLTNNEVNQVILKSLTGKVVVINNNFYIEQILKLMKDYFLDPKQELKFHAKEINYKSKGRPEKKETKALKKAVNLLCTYLDIKEKLLPKVGVKVSDQRRKFIDDLFNALDIERDKNYIQTILPK